MGRPTILPSAWRARPASCSWITGRGSFPAPPISWRASNQKDIDEAAKKYVACYINYDGSEGGYKGTDVYMVNRGRAASLPRGREIEVPFYLVLQAVESWQSDYEEDRKTLDLEEFANRGVSCIRINRRNSPRVHIELRGDAAKDPLIRRMLDRAQNAVPEDQDRLYVADYGLTSSVGDRP